MQNLTTSSNTPKDLPRQNLLKADDHGDSIQTPLVCPECDFIISASVHNPHTHCPRCHAKLPITPSPQRAESRRNLAWWLAVTGLLLAIPALSLPLATLKLAGMERHCTLLSGVEILWQQRHALVASLVLLTSVLAPILLLLITAVLTSLLALHARTPVGYSAQWTRHLLKLYEQATHWAMLDVYLLSLIVAYIKLIDYGNVTLGLGLLCYLLVMVMNLVILRQFTRHTAWQLWQQASEKPLS